MAKRVPQVVDCVQGARADFTQSFSASTASDSKSTWHALENDDPLLKAVCDNQA
jgi:hypothetical protein